MLDATREKEKPDNATDEKNIYNRLYILQITFRREAMKGRLQREEHSKQWEKGTKLNGILKG